MNFFDFLKTIFLQKKANSPDELTPEAASLINFKVVVTEFADNVESSGAEKVCSLLKTKEGLQVSYFNEPFNKSFLNLESRSFFDLLEKGQTIIDKSNADVLIWGCREGDKIRLNFQTNLQYETTSGTFTSILDSLYFPAEIFDISNPFPNSLSYLIYGAVISAIAAPNRQIRIQKRYLLKKIIATLSSDNSAKQLSVEYLPFIMNFLGIIYLSYSYDAETDKDFKIVKNLLETAISHQDLIKNPIHLGCIYYHLGQLYDSASNYILKKPSAYYKGAINNYRLAQKYLGKYTYPYDYGAISYRLADLFYDYWKQKNELQALRDSVFNLREAEKIFTYALFPEFWARIQGKLGYHLSLIANLTQSTDISELAIAAYKNQQKIITEKRDPHLWAEIQEKIGDIYFYTGRQDGDTDALEEALEYYHDALYIFENMELTDATKRLGISITKTSQLLN